jgi:cytochrome c
MQGRKHMNLSNWDQLTQEDRESLKSEIVHEIRAGEMPPLQYRFLHWNAKLNSQDMKSVSLLAKEAGIAEADYSAIGDPTRGEALFNRRCTGCHALDASREGPKLRGAFGRTAGKLPGFAYSSALKSSTITWDAASLNRWLSDTDAFIPGNNMDFQVLKAAERADIIAFLKQTQ